MKKSTRLLSIVLAMLMVISMMPVAVFAGTTALNGSGTEADPYQIGSLEDLIFFRDSVNNGVTTYNAEGVYVALTADIDLASVENWAPIGTWDYTFDGNFNGNGKKIKNLKMSDNTAANGMAYLGFFGITANNTIENLVFENVTISSNGQIVATAIAYPYYTEVKDITVCGDIAIKGGNYTAGVLAYTRLCTKASNLTVKGNAGSYITGAQVVGGIIADIQMNHGLKADYSNFKASGLTITGELNVGGISGIISGQTLNDAEVKDVALVCSDVRVGVIAGSLGDVSTITGVVAKNVTGAANTIGATYSKGVTIAAKIGDTYYPDLDSVNPYEIGSVEDLIEFRDSVNAGEGKYNNSYVILTADIDLSSVANWTPIGNVGYNSKYAPADSSKVFSGVFDGNGKVISNLQMTKIMNGGADAEANLGLFGITGEGAVIKDLTITNVDIETDGRNVGALVAFGHKATIDNITVNGDIQIKGGNNVSGVCAMSRYYAASVTNITLEGNDGSTIVGNNIVGGIFAEIAPNGAAQTFKNLSVENVVISGAGGVGGLVGLLTGGTVENVSVKDVALTGKTEYQGNAMGRIRLGSVSGLMGGKNATIIGASVDNVTAKNLDGNAVVLPVIGANYDPSSNATEAKISDTYYATFDAAMKAAKAGDTITLLEDITSSEIITINKAITLDGNGKTITYTGSGASARAIDVPANADAKVNVTIKDLTVNCTGSYCQRGINYNDDGALTLYNVTVKGTNVTYALNLPGSSDNCVVTITDSSLTGNIALNVWGENSEITATNSEFISVDNSTAEGYVAVSLNNDGKGNAATGSVVTINGGKIIAKDENGKAATAVRVETTATVTVSAETEVVGNTKYECAIVTYEGSGDFYSFDNLQDAIDKAIETNGKVVLINNITTADIITITAPVVIDGNGFTLTYTGASRAIDVPANADAKVNVTIKDLTVDCTASYCQRGINYNDDGALTLNNVTVKGTNVTYALNLPGSSDNSVVTITDSDLTGNIALNVWGENSEITATNSNFTAVDNNTVEGYAAIKLNNDGVTTAENTVVNIVGGKIDVIGLASTDTEAVANATSRGKVEISDTTEVNGKIRNMVAVIRYANDTFYSFESLADALAKAKDGETVTLIRDVESSEIITIDKAITLDGNGKTLKSSAGRAINVDTTAEVTIKNLTIVGGKGCERGINIINKAGTTNLEKVDISGVSHYAVNVATSAGAAKVAISDSNLTGYGALAIYGKGTTVNVTGSDLKGVNTYKNNAQYPHSNDFGAIDVGADNVTVTTKGGTITAVAGGDEWSAYQRILNVNASVEKIGGIILDSALVLEGERAEYLHNFSSQGTLSVRDDYADGIGAEGYTTKDADNGLVNVIYVPELPTATVTELDNEELTFALNFKADEATDEQLAYYGDWYADFVLTVNKDVTFNANGGADGYLSGQYSAWSENWVNVPFEDVTLKAGESLKIMEYAAELMGESGLKLTYNDVYSFVKDFDCGVFFEDEFIDENPDLKVTLELRMYNPDNEDENYVIGETYIFTIPPRPTATATDITNAKDTPDDLTFAMNFMADKVTKNQMKFYGDWYADFVLTVNKDVTLNANGDADGYLAGQYDAWSDNWVYVPFEDVTLKANEPLKIMAYAAELMGEPGLKYTFKEVYEVVNDFNCGAFFDEEFIAANPDLVVTLELRMYNPRKESINYVIGDTYVFSFGRVCWNMQTGKYYNDVSVALEEATSGQTVQMLQDYVEGYVLVTPGVTLDLNGCELTADYVVGFKGSNVIDGLKAGDGMIKVAQDHMVLDINNLQLPVYDGVSYVFAQVTHRVDLTTDENNNPRFDASPRLGTIAMRGDVADYIAVGKANSGVKIITRVTWTSEKLDDNGNTIINYIGTQDYEYSDEMVKIVMDSLGSNAEKPNEYGKMFTTTFAGGELEDNAINVQVSFVVKSDAGVEIQSNTTELKFN